MIENAHTPFSSLCFGDRIRINNTAIDVCNREFFTRFQTAIVWWERRRQFSCPRRAVQIVVTNCAKQQQQKLAVLSLKNSFLSFRITIIVIVINKRNVCKRKTKSIKNDINVYMKFLTLKDWTEKTTKSFGRVSSTWCWPPRWPSTLSTSQNSSTSLPSRSSAKTRTSTR